MVVSGLTPQDVELESLREKKRLLSLEVERLRADKEGWKRTAEACSDAAAKHLGRLDELKDVEQQRDALADALEAVDWTNQRGAVQAKIGAALRLAGRGME